MQSTSVYPLRNGNDIILPFCRPSSTRDSFIPSTIKMWNSLNNTIRNVDTLSKFQSELKKIDKTANHAIPKHYLGTEHLTCKGGGEVLWFFISFRIFFSDNTRVRIFIFLCAKREIFFQYSTLGYMTNTLNQIIFFFPPPKSEYFF